jgi:zinc transport system substrate-binding protein
MAGGHLETADLRTDHGHHHADGLDPHAWLDPHRAMALADTISDHLSRLRPGAAAEFQTRRDRLKERLARLDRDIQEILAPYAGAQFFVFHPAYGHFAKRYGLEQVAVEAGGHEPSARQLAAVISAAQAAEARVIVVQPQFSRRSAAAVAQAVGAEILVLDPLAADYEANLRHIAAALAAALQPAP